MIDYSIGDSPDDDEFTADIWIGEITFATIRYLEGKTIITLHPNIMKVDLEMDSEKLMQVIRKASSRLREFYVGESSN